MSDWKKNYADPILPKGAVTVTVQSIKFDETTGGTPLANITARIDQFDDEYNQDDPAVLAPVGQNVWGTIWLPKEADLAAKAHGKEVRIRKFLEIMENAGATLVVDDPQNDKPSIILAKSAFDFVGKSFVSTVEHSVDENGVYPTKAELNMMRVSRVR